MEELESEKTNLNSALQKIRNELNDLIKVKGQIEEDSGKYKKEAQSLNESLIIIQQQNQ